MNFLRERSYQKEIMDLEEGPENETLHAYRLIRHSNRFLGGTRVTLSHLKRFSRRWKPGETISILDAASGIADIPESIALWARRNGFSVRITALDLNRTVMQQARKELSAYPEISFVHGSIFDAPFEAQSFDYVITSQFFHHLDEKDIVSMLKSFSRIARRGMVVNDLIRRARAYAWIYLFSRFTSNRQFRNDAPLSVARGFRRTEAETLIRESGIPYLKYYEHAFHRFAIAGEI